MIVCKHCGAEIEENLEYCPNCGQNNTEKTSSTGSFFDSEEEMTDGYNIFDDSDDFDALFSQELSKKEKGKKEVPVTSISDILEDEELTESVTTSIEENAIEDVDLNSLDEVQSVESFDFVLPDGSSADGIDFALPEMDLSEQDILNSLPAEDVTEVMPDSIMDNMPGLDTDLVQELNFVELDDLLQDLEQEEHKEKENIDQNLSAMLAGSLEAEEPKKVKEKKSLFKSVFGNVPIDPSKIKPEPTEEEIKEAKQKKAEDKKQAAQLKRL